MEGIVVTAALIGVLWVFHTRLSKIEKGMQWIFRNVHVIPSHKGKKEQLNVAKTLFGLEPDGEDGE